MDSRSDIKNKRWLSNWGKVRRQGVLKYALLFGSIYFIIGIILVPLGYNLFRGRIQFGWEFFSESLPANLLISAGLGLALSLIQFAYNEARFRRLGSRYPSAVRLF